MKPENIKDLPDGWFDKADISTYRELVSNIPTGGTMLELGTWKGRSICSVADLLIERDIKVFAVDTFAGTPNEMSLELKDAHKEAKEVDLKKVFRDNLKRYKIDGRVTIIKNTTDGAVETFESGFFDLIFVDADHNTAAVSKDIKNYRPKLKKDGILAGHDWNWESVRKGVWENDIKPVALSNIWYLGKLLRSNKFSVCFIGRNEEKTLPRALESLKEFKAKGGEICYLDTGSTDKSAQIARDFGCVVEEVGDKFLSTITKKQADAINKKFIVDDDELCVKGGDKLFRFGDARNYCADNLATNDMISWMDCDEVFTKLDVDKIEDLISQGYDQFEYNFVFAHDQWGNEALKFIQSKFHNKKKIKWVGIIHEVLHGIGARCRLEEDILKLEHWQNQETSRTGYLKGLALDCWKNPNADRQSHYFARELLWNRRFKSAEKEFKRHLEISWWKPERCQSMIHIADCHFKTGDEPGGVEWLHRAYQEDGGRREPLMKLAEYYFWKKDWMKTASYCMAALEIPFSGYYSTHKPYYAEVPHQFLAECKWHMGDREASKYHHGKALEYTPLNSKLLYDYRFHNWMPKISILIPTLGRPEGLKKLQASIDKLNYPKEYTEVLIVEDEPRMGVPKRVAELFKKSTGDYIVYAANDMEFTPDSLILAFLDMQKEKKGLCAFNTGEVYPDEGNICEHFMITKELVGKIGGEIFDTDFDHCGVDNLLWFKCKRLNEAMRSERAKIIHHHFSKENVEFDEVYKIATKNRVKDAALLKKKIDEILLEDSEA